MATTRYVWEKWNTNKFLTLGSNITKKTTFYSERKDNVSSNDYISTTAYYTEGDSVSEDTGRIINGTRTGYAPTSAYWSQKVYVSAGKYFCINDGPVYKSNGTQLEFICRNELDGSGYWFSTYTIYSWSDATNFQAVNVEYAKGDTLLGTVASSRSDYHPSNGSDKYNWYVLKGTDTIDPVSVTHKTAIEPGEIEITINPSTGNVYGGTITYTIQTTTDGSNWVTDGTTTESSYTVTVPEGADKFGIRVQAKDDMGFTSSTYVYGNGTQTPYSVIHVSVNPLPGDIGYIAKPRIMEIGVDAKEATYSFKATLNGTVLANIASTSEPVQEITMSDSQFAGLAADTPHTLTVEIGQSGGTIVKKYTFRKFTYDNTTLSGVFDGTARALREKLGVTDKILGSKFPEKVLDLPRLPSITATPEKVFSGYTFADKFGKIRVGAPAKNTATAADIGHGKTAYNYLGELMTGIMSTMHVQAGSLQPTLQNKTYTIPYDAAVSGEKPSCILAYFNTWVGDYAEAGRHPSFSPYFFRGAASGQLYGLTSAAGGTMLNQNQTAANTTISVDTTSFSVTISQYDYVSGCEFCYILVW
jgi:hypothetical protein